MIDRERGWAALITFLIVTSSIFYKDDFGRVWFEFLKLVDLLIIYKKLVASDCIFVIRNKSGVQILCNDEKGETKALTKNVHSGSHYELKSISLYFSY